MSAHAKLEDEDQNHNEPWELGSLGAWELAELEAIARHRLVHDSQARPSSSHDDPKLAVLRLSPVV